MRLDLGIDRARGTQAESTADGGNLDTHLAQIPQSPTHPRRKSLGQRRLWPYNPELWPLTQTQTPCGKLGKLRLVTLLEGAEGRGRGMSAI